MFKKGIFIAAALMILSGLATGCSPAHLYSQPGRTAPLEAARTVGEDKRSLGVYAGPYGNGEINIMQFSGRYRQGLSDQVEVGVDGNLGAVTNMNDAATPVSPNIWSARLAAKWAPEVLGDYVGFIGGLAGGTYEAGQFISPDVGVIFAFENRWVVPFLSAGGYLSVPVNARAVDLSGVEAGPGSNVVTPRTTWGLTMTGGLRVPIDFGAWTVAPALGMSIGGVTDTRKDHPTVAMNAGLDVVF